MRELVILRVFAEEEAGLAHVKVKAFETAIAEADDWILFADVAFRLVLCGLSRGQTMHHWKPDETLRLMLEPAEEVLRFDGSFE